MSLLRWHVVCLAVVAAGFWNAPAQAQINIVIDYSLDTNNFFGSAGSVQRTALETAAARLTARLTDTFTAITPGPSGFGFDNEWAATFNHPGTGAPTSVSNLTIAQNRILVYAGGRDLTGGTLGVGGPGGFGGPGPGGTATGTEEFLQTLARGQYDVFSAPSSRTDFGAWGGAITFDSVGTNWNFSVASGPSAAQFDFLSVAEHELGHLLGIGTADSWKNLIPATSFTGTRAGALFGGNVPVTVDKGHWADGTTYLGQELALDPTIANGQRKEFTELDFAGLDDLGWDVAPVPEPAAVLGLAAGGLGGVWAVRHRRAARNTTPLAA